MRSLPAKDTHVLPLSSSSLSSPPVSLPASQPPSYPFLPPPPIIHHDVIIPPSAIFPPRRRRPRHRTRDALRDLLRVLSRGGRWSVGGVCGFLGQGVRLPLLAFAAEGGGGGGLWLPRGTVLAGDAGEALLGFAEFGFELFEFGLPGCDVLLSVMGGRIRVSEQATHAVRRASASSGSTYFSATFWDRRSTPCPPPPAPPALRPNMESRSLAKLCATVLVTRECLLLLGASEVFAEEVEGTYDWAGAAAEPLEELLLLLLGVGCSFSIVSAEYM